MGGESVDESELGLMVRHGRSQAWLPLTDEPSHSHLHPFTTFGSLPPVESRGPLALQLEGDGDGKPFLRTCYSMNAVWCFVPVFLTTV